MPKGQQFYSEKEDNKPEDERVHHDNSECSVGRKISMEHRRNGTGGYQLCPGCVLLNARNR